MKIAISGKGGVGKTTLAAFLSQIYAETGHDVLAVDADPSPSLALALGVPEQLRAGLKPISQMEDLILERTGAKPGSTGGFFTLNPRVDDIPARFSIAHRGVRLLELGAIDQGGSGCICPESALLKTLITHLLFRQEDVLIVDFYAGVEHLGRATADFVDIMLIVSEPTRRSAATARQIVKLARDIGLDRLWLVGNKIQNEGESAFLQTEIPGIPILGMLPASPGVLEADRMGISVVAELLQIYTSTLRIAEKIESQYRRYRARTSIPDREEQPKG